MILRILRVSVGARELASTAGLGVAAYFSLLYVRVRTTFCAPGVSCISNGLLSRKSLILTGCGSFSFISASNWISLVSFALSSPSTPLAARRSREVENAANCGREGLH